MKYITDEIFSKMTKKEKQAVPVDWNYYNEDEIEICKVVFMPTREKMSEYVQADIFAQNKDGWFKATTYDCWRIVVDMKNPSKFNYNLLQGDFENGGVQIFGFGGTEHTAFIGYGGNITIRNK